MPTAAAEVVPIADPAEWRALLVQAGPTALEQSWAYGEAACRRHGQVVERLALRIGGAPCALVQSFGRRVLRWGHLSRIVRGPAWIGAPSPQTERAVLQAIRAHHAPGWRRRLLWMPELPDGAAVEATMRAAGLRRVVTGYSSAWLDLSPDEAALRAGLDGNWRNALGAAEREGLLVARRDRGAALDAQLAAYDAFRRSHRFVGPAGAFIRALVAGAGREERALVLAAAADGRDVAGIVLLRHGAAATYYAGWTSADGRRLNAHNLLLWQGLLRLRAAKVRWLDLGGISAAAPGVARFKLGVGGRFFTLAGTYM